MKCIHDAGSSEILRVSDSEAAWLVSQKPNRYKYMSKSEYKVYKQSRKPVQQQVQESMKAVYKSRKGRRANAEYR